MTVSTDDKVEPAWNIYNAARPRGDISAQPAFYAGWHAALSGRPAPAAEGAGELASKNEQIGKLYRVCNERTVLRNALQDLCDAWDCNESKGHVGGRFKGNVTDAHAAAKRALSTASPSPGRHFGKESEWQLVPKKPTEEMKQAVRKLEDTFQYPSYLSIYAASLAAAPQPDEVEK